MKREVRRIRTGSLVTPPLATSRNRYTTECSSGLHCAGSAKMASICGLLGKRASQPPPLDIRGGAAPAGGRGEARRQIKKRGLCGLRTAAMLLEAALVMFSSSLRISRSVSSSLPPAISAHQPCICRARESVSL